MLVNKGILAVVFSALLFGCNSGSDSSSEDDSDACALIQAPFVNITLHDSIDDTLAIEDATVEIIATGDDWSESIYPEYISYEGQIDSDEPVVGAYYASIAHYDSSFTISIQASADGYNSAVVKDYTITTKSGCDEDNGFSIDMYLCPENNSCL